MHMPSLAGLDLPAVIATTLTAQAEAIAEAVRESLSHSPADDQTTPARRTGALHDSIAIRVSGGEALIGSTSAVAVDQEFGTRSIPPRPFLAPAAAAHAESASEAIATAIVTAIRSS